MEIKIKIEPTFSVKWPMLKIKINDHVVYENSCEPNHGKFFVFNNQINDVRKRNSLEIEHYDKKGKETLLDDNDEIISDRAIILRSVVLDEFEIPDLILHDRPFEIKWTSEQLKEDDNRPRSIKNNLYFGYNGTYKFEFGNNSAKEYYLSLLEKERIANIHNKKEMVGPDGTKIEVFEFSGNLVDSNKQGDYTIGDLFKRIKNEN